MENDKEETFEDIDPDSPWEDDEEEVNGEINNVIIKQGAQIVEQDHESRTKETKSRTSSASDDDDQEPNQNVEIIKERDVEISRLKDMIKHLESELMQYKQQEPTKTSDIDPELSDYLESHDLNLASIKEINEIYSELKTNAPDNKTIREYINELKTNHSKNSATVNELMAKNLELDLKVQIMKQKLKDELLNISEARVEDILKNSGAKEYCEKIKEKNKIKDDMINDYKKELDHTRRELNKWKDKVQDLEKQVNKYYQEWKSTLHQKVQAEAELKALKDLGRMPVRSNSNSSMEYGIPPPPPVEMPTIAEILGHANRPTSYNNMDFSASSIPPPPEVEPFELFKNMQ